MPYITVNDIRMYYELHGAGDPLVLIMGLRRNAEWWFRQIPALSERFQVLAFDNRGAGRTDKPETDYSIGMFADDTAGLMKALGLDRAHILGISMGGYIAQELAVNYPDRVNRLLIGCTGSGGKRAVRMSDERMARFIENKGLTPEEILRKDMDIYFSDGFIRDNPEFIESFIEISMRYYQPPDAFLRQWNACLNHDTTNRLHTIALPTMIMTGDDDPLVPPENSRILKELIPHASFVTFPGCRHCFFIEAADAFNAEAVRFFSEQ